MMHNPIIARVLRQQSKLTWREIGGLFMGASVVFFGILITIFSSRTLLTIASLSGLGYLLLLSLIVSWRSALSTEKTLHGGFYDLVLKDLSDQEIVLGHMLVGFFSIRVWITVGLALIFPLSFMMTGWVVSQNWSCAEVTLSCQKVQSVHYLMPWQVLMGLIGLNIFAAVLGVAVSLYYQRQRSICAMLVVALSVLNVLWILGIYSAFTWIKEVDIQQGIWFKNTYLIATIFTLILPINLLTFRQNHPMAVGFAAFMPLIIGTIIILTTIPNFTHGMIAFLVVYGISWLIIVRNDPRHDLQFQINYQYLATAIVFVGFLATLGATLVMFYIYHDWAWLGLLSISLLALLPYFMATLLLYLAERWTERPFTKYSTVDE